MQDGNIKDVFDIYPACAKGGEWDAYNYLETTNAEKPTHYNECIGWMNNQKRMAGTIAMQSRTKG